MIPHIEFLVESIPGCPTCDGRTRGPLVWLRKGNPHLAGSRAHELAHVKQWWMGVIVGAVIGIVAMSWACPWWPIVMALGAGLHGAAYKLIGPYRQWSEIEATRAKLDAEGWPDDLLRAEAADLIGCYGFVITLDEAVRLIHQGGKLWR